MNPLNNYLLAIGLTETQSDQFSAIFSETILLEKGEFFHKNGQVCKRLGFIVEGMCRYYYDTEEEEVTRWVSFKNEFTGSLSSFISQKKSPENIQAITPAEVLIASKQDWQDLYHEQEFVRQIWVKHIEEYYIGMEDRIFNLIALTAEERYKWMLENQPKFNQYVPDKYVASMLGIKPRHLSRIRGNRK
jgi:CRP-like cAMP-binding protein